MNAARLLPLALFVTACENACESTVFADKLASCGIEVPDGVTDAEVGLCSKDEAALVACVDACTSQAGCDAFDGTNLDAAQGWATCKVGCSTASTDE